MRFNDVTPSGEPAGVQSNAQFLLGCGLVTLLVLLEPDATQLAAEVVHLIGLLYRPDLPKQVLPIRQNTLSLLVAELPSVRPLLPGIPQGRHGSSLAEREVVAEQGLPLLVEHP